MKNLFLATVLLLGGTAFGSHFVCAGPEFYFSSVQSDFGVEPPPGTKLGKVTIVLKGKVVEDTEVIQNGGDPLKHYVQSIGPETILKKTGNKAAGTRVFTQTLALLDEHNAELFRSSALCEFQWALAP